MTWPRAGEPVAAVAAAGAQEFDKAQLRVYLLGPLRVFRPGDARPVAARARDKSWQLFKYLLLHRGSVVPTDEVLDLFWPDRADEEDTGLLRSALTRLKSRLEPNRPAYLRSAYVIYRRDSCGLAPAAPVWVDADEFERLSEAAHQQEKVHPDAALPLYRQALALYQGDLLADEPYADWAVSPREYYHRLYVMTAKQAAAICRRVDDAEAAVRILQRALAAEPYDEELHVQLMQALLATGQPQAAIRHYEQAAHWLAQELGVSPSAELKAVHEQAKAAGLRARTAPVTARPRPTLPQLRQAKAEAAAGREPGAGPVLTTATEGRPKGTPVSHVMGAFVCDPETFHQFVSLEQRRLVRQSTVSTVLLVAVASPGSGKPAARAMAELVALCRQCLRSCDVVSQRPSGRVAILCPDTPVNGARVAAVRIKQAWAAVYQQGSVRWRVWPLRPDTSGQPEPTARA